MAGPRAEVYGFVLWITTFVFYGAYFTWAYIPERVLQQLGISYFPSKYWAIAIPTYIGVSWIICVLIYVAVNLISTAPLDSIDTITDQHAHEIDEEDHHYRNKGGIPPIADIPITVVNKLLYHPPERPQLKRERHHSSDRLNFFSRN